MDLLLVIAICVGIALLCGLLWVVHTLAYRQGMEDALQERFESKAAKAAKRSFNLSVGLPEEY